MDSLTQADSVTTARDIACALIALLDVIDDEPSPEFSLLRDESFWRVRGYAKELTGTLYDHRVSATELLETWREKFGGEIQPTTEKHFGNWFWHALKTEIGGVPVVLKVPVEQADVEQQLRDRIAELEAALNRDSEGGEGQ